jgi:tetratricopeptide (TPR) repeat protein
MEMVQGLGLSVGKCTSRRTTPEALKHNACAGLVLERMGRVEEALAWHYRSLAANSNYGPALLHSGLMLHKLGQREEALPQQLGGRAGSWDCAAG